MTKNTKIINSLVFLVWGGLICLLLYRDYTGTALNRTGTLTGVIDKAVYWYDIYNGPQKIGFASTSYDKIGNENIIHQQREMQVTKNGKATVLYDAVKFICAPNYSIKSLEYSSHFKDEQGLKATGKVDSDGILFFLEAPELRRTFRTPTKGREFYFPMTFIPILAGRSPAPQSSFSMPVLDLNMVRINDWKIVVEEVRPFKVGIDVRSMYKFRTGDSVWWSNEKGIIIKEESPAGPTLYLENEYIAKDPSNRKLFDYTALPFFKTNKVLPHQEDLRRLKVRITGFSLDPGLYKETAITLKDNILTIEKQDPGKVKENSYELPYKGGLSGRYLQSDEWVLAENKTVQGNAHNFAVIEKNDAFRLARFLNSNLYFTVKNIPAFSLVNAEEIFKTRSGDDIGRTIMFASFARAAGLPTRLIGGLVYRNGYFYFHTWPEVWLGKWVPMEPTLAQFPADVTHIPLKEGSIKDIISIVDNLKNITIEIQEAL